VAHLVLCAGSVLLYLALGIATFLTGRGLLRLLRLPLPSLPAVLLAVPAGLVFWTLLLGLTGGCGVPVKYAAPCLWGVSGGLMIYGLWRPWPDLRGIAWLALCAFLPLVVMPRHFWHGLTQFPGSIAPDGWSYIAVAQYMWEYPRGTQGGLAPLYQFASHLSDVRYTAFSLLGFLSPLVRAGDTAAVAGLFNAWALFAMTAAVALFWVACGEKTWVAVAATVLSTAAGWVSNLVWANNYDNLLALAYLPALAALVRLFDPRLARWWAVVGALLAAVLYTYPELAPFIGAGAVLVALPRAWEERSRWRLWLGGSAGAVAFAAVLVCPSVRMLLTFLNGQIHLAQAGSGRPGEGIFGGLGILAFQPAAFWGLGAEHQLTTGHAARQVIALALTALALAGLVILAREKSWGLAGICTLLILGTTYLIVRQHYSYGAYKLLVLNWWCLVAAALTATRWLLGRVPAGLPRRAGAVLAAALALAVISQSQHTDAATTAQYINSPNQPLRLAQFRSLHGIKKVVGDQPLLLVVDDWLANEWAVYFLRDQPLYLPFHRMYMSMPAFEERMRQAAVPPLETIDYVLADVSANKTMGTGLGQRLVWSGGPYRLYQAGPSGIALITGIQNANGVEAIEGKRFFWMGRGNTTVDVFASRGGLLALEADFRPGPSVEGKPERTVHVTGPTGDRHTVTLTEGKGTFAVPVAAGRNSIVLSPVDVPDAGPVTNGDARPLVLGVLDLRVSLQPEVVVGQGREREAGVNLTR
jgi:hypothetical protein